MQHNPGGFAGLSVDIRIVPGTEVELLDVLGADTGAPPPPPSIVPLNRAPTGQQSSRSIAVGLRSDGWRLGKWVAKMEEIEEMGEMEEMEEIEEIEEMGGGSENGWQLGERVASDQQFSPAARHPPSPRCSPLTPPPNSDRPQIITVPNHNQWIPARCTLTSNCK